MSDSIKSIGTLVDEKYHFSVEDYQRGYKWTKTQVEQLLTDINAFSVSEKSNSFYCLQPVVVKAIQEKEGKMKFELIDGQQRMTTIYIIFSFLEQNVYEMDYKTRKGSAFFLKNIKSLSDYKDWNHYIETNSEKNNIDNYHFFTAYQTIKEWFNGKTAEQGTFLEKLKKHVKVIWYEVQVPKSGGETRSKQESIKIFNRLNNGKIALTNAELIKALFLIHVGDHEHAELLKLKQNEIAQQWDSIEYALQNDAFWYFLSNEKPIATRIEFIFDLIKEKPRDIPEKLFTFIEYNKDFASQPDKMAWVKTNWETVYKTFLTLQEWYEDRTLYHLIGFLVCSRMDSVAELYKEKRTKTEMTKKAWVNHIEAKIKAKIKDSKLEDLVYKKNDSEINKILLLYNIETELKSTEANRKYPLDKHKNENWSLEHIHAQNQDDLTEKTKIESYVNGFIDYIKNFDKDKAQELCDFKKDLETTAPNGAFPIQQFINKAKEFFPDLVDLHKLNNLALLSAPLNAGIGNGFFDKKRAKIIEFDKKGAFIPICTKNVFLKYYSKAGTTNLFYWSGEDRANYLEDIKKTLAKYIN